MKAATSRVIRRVSGQHLSATSTRPSLYQYRLLPSQSIIPPPARVLLPLYAIRGFKSEPDYTLPPPRSNDSSGPGSNPSSAESQTIASFPLAEKPAYELTFTCKKCTHRSTHKVSKQAYHKGTVLIQCPGCEVRHLIADHLKIFRDNPTTIEDIMREQGEKVRKGIKMSNGDIEILPEEEDGEPLSEPEKPKLDDSSR